MNESQDLHLAGVGQLFSVALEALVTLLQRHDAGGVVDDAERIDRVRQCERLKSVCAAVQAQEVAAFAASQSAEKADSEIRVEKTRRSVAAQVALARRDSPTVGARHVGVAKVLTAEMPHTFAALRSGELSEWQATLMVRETATLSLEHRQIVDAELAGKLGCLGSRQVEQAARRIGYRLDAEQAAARARRAASDRRVTLRAAPDTMSYVTALVPLVDGVAVCAALKKYATAAKAAGDVRSRGQLMADEFVNRAINLGSVPAPAIDQPASESLATNPSDRTAMHFCDEAWREIGSFIGSAGGELSASQVEIARTDEILADQACHAASHANGDADHAAYPADAWSEHTDADGDRRVLANADTDTDSDRADADGDRRVLANADIDSYPADADADRGDQSNADSGCDHADAGRADACAECADSDYACGDHTDQPDLANQACRESQPGDVYGGGCSLADAEAAPIRDDDCDSRPSVDSADAAFRLPLGVGVEIQLVMTDRTLFDGDSEPAILTGFGPLPAPLARRLIREANANAKVWVRRLYMDPKSGDVVGADQRRRLFPPALREVLITRDQVCRNSWCGAPIRHIDHINPFMNGGLTTLGNGQGCCETCNQTKEAPGWSSAAGPDGSIVVTTPTGHTYPNRPPRPPRSAPWRRAQVTPRSKLRDEPRADIRFCDIRGRLRGGRAYAYDDAR